MLCEGKGRSERVVVVPERALQQLQRRIVPRVSERLLGQLAAAAAFESLRREALSQDEKLARSALRRTLFRHRSSRNDAEATGSAMLKAAAQCDVQPHEGGAEEEVTGVGGGDAFVQPTMGANARRIRALRRGRLRKGVSQDEHGGVALRPLAAAPLPVAAPNPSALDATEAGWRVRCLAVERRALVFAHRALWIETVAAHAHELRELLRVECAVDRQRIGIIQIQRTWRMHRCRAAFQRVRRACVLLQRVGRAARLRCGSLLQCRMQSLLARCVVRVAAGFAERRRLGRDHAQELQQHRVGAAATRIQAMWRMAVHRSTFVEHRVRCAAAVTLQRAVRPWLAVCAREQRRNAAAAAEREACLAAGLSGLRALERCGRFWAVEDEAELRTALACCFRMVLAALSKQAAARTFMEAPRLTITAATAAAAAAPRPQPQPPLPSSLLLLLLRTTGPSPAIPREADRMALQPGPCGWRRRRLLEGLDLAQQEAIARCDVLLLPEALSRASLLLLLRDSIRRVATAQLLRAD